MEYELPCRKDGPKVPAVHANFVSSSVQSGVYFTLTLSMVRDFDEI
jgi:hypothetical protein